MSDKQLTIIKWSARITSLVFLIFGLLFYFGYGNPLPFINPDYTWIENLWLTLVPIVFIGMAVGWFYERLGGYLIIIPLGIGFITGVLAQANMPTAMLVTLIPAILYLISSYAKHY